MTGLPSNPDPNQQPVLHPPTQQGAVRRHALMFADLVKSAVIILFWAILGCAAIAAGIVACRAIYWAANLMLQALGV